MITGRFARDLADMTATVHDVLVVGGGIMGATIARDAAMRGLRVALVEKNDFSSGTSAASSKLVHGGLRYLRNLEIGLVRESLAERRIWQRIAPHMVRPLSFLLPTDAGHRRMLSLGLTIYDWLAFDRNRGLPKTEAPARHRFIDWPEAQRLEPTLSGAGGTGAFEYTDCQMDSPERLGLECLIDAAAHGSCVANYAEAQDFIVETRGDIRHVRGATILDRLDGHHYEVYARLTVNACGPWADDMLTRATGKTSHALVHSKGIHIVTRPLTRKFALTLQVPDSLGGGHVFILPWRGHSLIGTTDAPFDGRPDDVRVTAADVEALVRTVNGVLPGVQLQSEDVVYAYAGLRPLVGNNQESQDTYAASRRSEIADHEKADGLYGLVSALGGKWTTSRHVAEKTVGLILAKLKRKHTACRTANTPLPGVPLSPWQTFLPAAKAQHPALAEETVEHLARSYGARFEIVLAYAKARPDLADRLCANRPEIGAEILFAMREEMARRLGDVVFRRTSLGSLGHPGRACLEKVADLMARELNWSADERSSELNHVQHRLTAWKETAA